MADPIEVIDDLWEKRSYAFKWTAPPEGEEDILDEINQTIEIALKKSPPVLVFLNSLEPK